ncbi:hypothetical protein JOF48_001481 [Arthrobacter stackebrandtii]|uniref:Uncharacterized protein n=1 Tax=Arthrobacter stackebrandtii TaxID=272161 RepID=A0ABS4YV58_9MICC|nr:hypothetical protein [Arthrobacter stackebrandtii]MBP2412682.1 hypothetical protein [Arthrobacter stackebrandtii]
MVPAVGLLVGTRQPDGTTRDTRGWHYAAGEQMNIAAGQTNRTIPFKICNTLGSGS